MNCSPMNRLVLPLLISISLSSILAFERGQLFISSYFGAWGESDLVIVIDQDLKQLNQFYIIHRPNQSPLIHPCGRGRPSNKFDKWGGPAVKIIRDHIANQRERAMNGGG